MANQEEQKVNLEQDNQQEQTKEQVQEKQDQKENNQEQTQEQKENLMTEEQLEALRALSEHFQSLTLQAQEQAQKERAKADEYAKRLVNLQGEFDNYRKRNLESVKTAQIEGRCQVLLEVIKILDIIEQAIGMIKDDATASGVKMIYRQVENILKNFDVQEIETEGDFDPNLHSAVELVKSEEHKSGSIVEVVQKGYRLGEKILRHASVKVAQ
ncbi:MAG TPA: nucleotide exchange factor GrpE [Clostridia bacterium]|jgi:molecular chaperone GrpE